MDRENSWEGNTPPRRQTALALAIVVAAALLFASPILQSGKLPAGTDAAFHAQLADGVFRGLQDGHVYPRWISEANLGYGSAALINYGPLSSYAVALVAASGPSVIAAMKGVAILSALCAGLAFYACARSFAPPLPSALAAAFYVMLPSHVLELYDRFGFAAFNAFVWPPLLVRFVRELDADCRYGAWAAFVLAYAGLLLTHIAVAYAALFIIVPYALGLCRRRRSWRLVAVVGTGGLAATLVAAAYVWPLLAERGFTHADRLLEFRWAQWSRNFAFAPGRAAADRFADPGLISALVVVAAAIPFLSRSRANEGWLLALLSGLAIFLQLPVSSFLWASIPGMPAILFPWRFQAFQGLFAGLVVACALAQSPTRLARCVIGAAVLAAVAHAATLTGSRPYSLDQAAFERGRLAERVQREHIPVQVPKIRPLEGATVADDRERAWLDGDGGVAVIEWSSHVRRLAVESEAPRMLGLRTFFFPGWEARLDGAPVEISPDSHWGVIALLVPPGRHEIEVRFRNTRVRTAGAVASSLTLLGLGGGGLAAYRRRHQAGLRAL
jgi:hypothetical protein